MMRVNARLIAGTGDVLVARPPCSERSFTFTAAKTTAVATSGEYRAFCVNNVIAFRSWKLMNSYVER